MNDFTFRRESFDLKEYIRGGCKVIWIVLDYGKYLEEGENVIFFNLIIKFLNVLVCLFF